MIAQINRNNKICYSYVYAVDYKNGKMIILDKEKSELIVIKIYSQNMVFESLECSNWAIDTELFKCYWNMKNIFKLVKDKKYSTDILNEAKLLQDSINIKKWHKLKTKSDIELLEYNSSNFHDNYVINISRFDNDLEIILDSSWGNYIHLYCKDVVECDLKENVDFFDAEIILEEDKVMINFIGIYDEDYMLVSKEIEFAIYLEIEKKYENYQINKEINKLILSNKSENLELNLNNVGNISRIQEWKIYHYEQADTCLLFYYDDAVYVINADIPGFLEELSSLGINIINKGLSSYYDNFGDIIYQQEYNRIVGFSYFLKFASIPILINMLFWLMVKLLSNCYWSVFYIFGLGISGLMLLLFIIIFIVKKDEFKNKMILYNNGILCFGHTLHINILYNDITSVVYKNRIILYSNEKKYKLLKSKNDKYIYNLIKAKINEQ